ncbi:MAG: hypothetical protein B6I30_03225 [Desulfobacteraceae bacterium 4572_187]|nr:MAG: hypothetical protein B6I30_03225 [Desulfobacteraceae bacterium 4572_187]
MRQKNHKYQKLISYYYEIIFIFIISQAKNDYKKMALKNLTKKKYNLFLKNGINFHNIQHFFPSCLFNL